MIYLAKTKIKRLLSKEKSFATFGEDLILKQIISSIEISNRTIVDIGASGGIENSNTYIFFKDGWEGLAVEYSSEWFSQLAQNYKNFPQINLSKCKVTPENIISLLRANTIADNFSVLSLDIDGYDFFVLERILKEYRPSVICTEINEKIPPPIRFTVNWDKNYCYESGHFFGQSISQVYSLCREYNYQLVNLHYCNAFFVPQELNKAKALDPKEAYETGYLDREDRKRKFPWNKDMEELLHLEPAEALEWLKRYFSKYNGQYTAEILS